jgi:hypothetical protein
MKFKISLEGHTVKCQTLVETNSVAELFVQLPELIGKLENQIKQFLVA